MLTCKHNWSNKRRRPPRNAVGWCVLCMWCVCINVCAQLWLQSMSEWCWIYMWFEDEYSEWGRLLVAYWIGELLQSLNHSAFTYDFNINDWILHDIAEYSTKIYVKSRFSVWSENLAQTSNTNTYFFVLLHASLIPDARLFVQLTTKT